MEVRQLQVALANIGAPPLLPSRDRQCLGAITEQDDRATIVALFVSQAVRPRGAEVVEVTPVDLAGWNYRVSAGEGVVADLEPEVYAGRRGSSHRHPRVRAPMFEDREVSLFNSTQSRT